MATALRRANPELRTVYIAADEFDFEECVRAQHTAQCVHVARYVRASYSSPEYFEAIQANTYMGAQGDYTVQATGLDIHYEAA